MGTEFDLVVAWGEDGVGDGWWMREALSDEDMANPRGGMNEYREKTERRSHTVIKIATRGGAMKSVEWASPSYVLCTR
jgi:hypothetical protein